MPLQSRRAIITGPNTVVMKTVPLDHDRPRPGEVLLETTKSFISAGTELANFTGLDPTVFQKGAWNAYPWPPGYCNVARVAAVGRGVPPLPDGDTVRVGDRVLTWGKHASHHFFGDFANQLFVKVPEGIDDEVAAAARMAEVSIAGLQVADLQLNDWVAVFGLGLVGNFCAQLYRLAGARVIGVDPSAPRQRLARSVGIDHVLGRAGASDAEIAAEVRAICRRSPRGEPGPTDGAHITVDAVGDSRVIRQAAEATANFGQVVILGSPRAKVEGDLTQVLHPIHWRFVTFKGALEWRQPRLPQPGVRHSIWGNVQTILDLTLQGKLRVAELISHRMSPEDIGRAYDGLLNKKDEYWGVVLDWEGEKRKSSRLQVPDSRSKSKRR